MVNHISPIKSKILNSELLRVSSNNAGPLARNALEQNFECFSQTGVVLGLNASNQAHPMKMSTVAFSAQAKVTMVDAQDRFNQHLLESFAHSSQLIWLRTLIPTEKCLKLGRLNHPEHLEATLSQFNRHSWLRLLNQFALAYQVDNPNALLRGKPIEINGVQIRLHYSESHPDHFVLQVDAGAIPASLTQQQSQMLAMSMLQANHKFSMASGMEWSINPQTNHAVLSIEWNLFNGPKAPISGEDLHRLMTQHIQLSQITWMSLVERVLKNHQVGACDLANSALPDLLPFGRSNCSEIH